MRSLGNLMLLALVLSLSGAVATATPSETPPVGQEPELACVVMTGDRMPPATRRSPLDSVTFAIQEAPVKICYGRPSARGRTIMGGLLPYGELWRTGANEPTMIHTSASLEIAGIRIEPGSYSLYTVPGENEWQVIVNRSISQWGHEGRYTEEVRAQEVGRASVSVAQTEEHVERFTIRATPAEGGNATLLLEWERARVEVPVKGAM